MAKVLAVLANPRAGSYTSRLMRGFLEAYQRCHPADEIVELNLYQADIPVIDNNVLTAWSKVEEQLTAAERLLLFKIYHFTDQLWQPIKSCLPRLCGICSFRPCLRRILPI